MVGTDMHTHKLHLCVDGRYAINHFPGIGRVTSALATEWATHPQVSRLDIIINAQSTNSVFALPHAPHVHIHHIDTKPFGIVEWISMRHIMHQIRPDWIYAPYVHMPPRTSHSRRMLTIHDAIPLELRNMSWGRQTLLKHFVRWNMLRADCVTTVSAHAAHQIRRYYDYQHEIAIVPNGVSAIFWQTPTSNTITKHGITMPYMLCVSSNQPHKNIQGLLSAWHMAYTDERIPHQSQLVIAGHVDQRRNKPWQQPPYDQLPVVHIPDPSDELLNELYHGAHLFVMPSLAEGFGLPIIEALAAGCVVLCHDYPTLRQLHGDTVHYTDMRHIQAIAHDLGEVWHNQTLRTHYQHQSQPHARTFHWQSIAHQYVELMHKDANSN